MASMRSDVRPLTLAVTASVLMLVTLYAAEPAPLPLVAVNWLALALIGWWRPVALLALIAATLPLYHQPLDLASATFAPSELLLGALLPGSAVIFLRQLRLAGRTGILDTLTRQGIARIAPPAFLLGVAAFALLGLAGFTLLLAVNDVDARAAGLREWRWTLAEPLAFVVLLLLHARNRGARSLIAGGFAAGVLGAAVWGLLDGVLGQGVSAGGVLRVDGPFPHPNAYALYLLRAAATGAALLLLTGERRIWPWALVGLVLAALGLSFARSAGLGGLVAVIILLPWMSRRLRALTLGGAAVAVVALIVLAGDRFIGTSGTDSLALRGDIWVAALAMIRDQPLLGYGPDQFLYTYTPRYIDPAAWAERFTAHAPNQQLDAWIRIGILGFAAAGLTIWAVGRRSLRMSRASGIRDPLAAAAVVGLAAALAQGMVDNGYFVHDLAMSAWLLLWLGFASMKTAQPERGRTV